MMWCAPFWPIITDVAWVFPLISVGLCVVIGLAGSIGLTRAISGLLYGVSAFDLAAFAGATALLVGIAVAASILPARRASALDPVDALRGE